MRGNSISTEQEAGDRKKRGVSLRQWGTERAVDELQLVSGKQDQPSPSLRMRERSSCEIANCRASKRDGLGFGASLLALTAVRLVASI